ncbi:MAG: hypothetical protein IPK67_13335 [Planctomycetes bacterium]|nr:hypothetical protein [Planctomycetota bacterium]
MKPRTAQPVTLDDQEELHVDSEPYVEPGRPSPSRRSPGGRSGDAVAALAVVAGLGAFGAGALLALGTIVSPQLGKFQSLAATHGIEAGSLAIGGALLAMLGVLRRGQVALRKPTAEQMEDRLLLEQLTKDSLRSAEMLERLENSLEGLSIAVANSRKGLEDRVTQCAREVVAAIPEPIPPASPEEAIFRLAASLDQVGMRIEQRLKTQYTALQDHIEDVGAAILSARNQMQGIAQREQAQAQSLREEVQTQVERALEETGFWSAAQGNPNSHSLGVLDTIEEPCVENSLGGLHDLGSIDAALPANGDEAGLDGYTPGAANSALNMDVDTKTRLVQLSSLLADPKLRRALEGMGHSDGQ